jgi:hypothetical protein
VHWTYKAADPKSDLEQGDLLSATEPVRELLRQVHPHFCAPKYIGFSVTTQSCDLVSAHAKARHISIAAIRSLSEVAPSLFARITKSDVVGIAKASAKGLVNDFLKRLLDQNEQSQGLFYLHPDSDIGWGEPSLAFLRVTVSLKSEHAELLKQARVAHLDPEFRAKFGWLLGNLYSRAASPDWADREGGAEQLRELIARYTSRDTSNFAPVWIDDVLLEAAKRQGYVATGKTLEQLEVELEDYRPKSNIEVLAEEVARVVSKVAPAALSDDQLKSLQNRVRNSGVVSKLVKA